MSEATFTTRPPGPEQNAARRRSRIVGALVLAALLLAGLAILLFGRPDDRDDPVQAGLTTLAAALAAPARDEGAFDRAESAFREALARDPFDPYPAFLLNLAGRLRAGAPLPPEPSDEEQALHWIARGELDAARLLLARRPAARRSPEAALLLRFLDDLPDRP